MREYLKQIAYLLAGVRRHLVLLSAIFFVSSVFDLLGIGLLGQFAMTLGNNEAAANFGFIDKALKWVGIEGAPSLTTICMIILLVFILKNIVSLFANKLIIQFSFDHQRKIMDKMIEHYLYMPYRFFKNTDTAHIVEVTTGSTTTFVNKCLIPILRLSCDGMMMVLLLCFIIANDVATSVALIAAVTIVFLVQNSFIRKRVTQYGVEYSRSSRDLIEIVNESIGGIREIRILDKEAFFLQRFARSSKSVTRTGAFYNEVGLLPRALLEIVFVAIVIGLAIFADLRQEPEQKAKLLGLLGVFAGAALRILPSLNQIFNAISQLRFSKEAVDKLSTTLKKFENEPNSLKKTASALDQMPAFSAFAEIHFSHVSLIYDQQKPAVNDVSFSIKRGQFVGIIGRSGSGKTTVIDLLIGLLNPDQGEILVDGIPIRENIRAWMRKVAYIPQEPFMINGSVRDNILFGTAKAEQDEQGLLAALRSAHLSEVVEQLPAGLDTSIGERGQRLSGGQRQRLALARAFYHQKDILVFDEATSALDNETEATIMEFIANSKGQKTMVMIAHRVQTLQRCDVILKFSEGRLVETGSFEALVGS